MRSPAAAGSEGCRTPRPRRGGAPGRREPPAPPAAGLPSPAVVGPTTLRLGARRSRRDGRHPRLAAVALEPAPQVELRAQEVGGLRARAVPLVVEADHRRRDVAEL